MILRNNDDKKVNYTPFECRVFTALSKKKKSTVDITDVLYDTKKRPRYARQSVLGALISLSKKVKENKEPFEVKRSVRKGPHPVQFWVER